MISVARAVVAVAGTTISVIACLSTPASQPGPAAQITPTSTPPGQPSAAAPATPAPTKEPAPADKVRVLAPVDSVEIQVDGGSAELVLVTGLPNACYESADHTVTQDGNAITVSVMNLGPGDSPVACAEIYRLEERRIPLRQVIEPCALYSVEVNGQTHEVQAIGPAIRCSAPEQPVTSDDTTEEDSPAVVHLRVEPVTSRPLTVRFTAEIIGGLDNSKELYCEWTAWEFGDGRRSQSATECLVWSPAAKFDRQHEQTYTYEKPGTYEALFAYGPLAPVTVTVDVQYTPLDDADPGNGMTPVGAPIDGVSIEVTESVPPQYFIVVQSGLPNGCARFGGYTVDRGGRHILVRVINLVPEDKNVVCTQVYGTVKSRIPLGSYFEQGTRYTVYVNDVTHPFHAKRGRPTEAGPGPTPDIDRPFELRIGESTLFQAEALEVRFEGVVEDSRCPADVKCVSAGRATAAISIFDLGGKRLGNLELTLSGNQELSFKNIGGYSVTLRSLERYPGTPEAIAQGEDPDYTARLLVSGAVEDAPQERGPAVAHLSVEPVPGQPLTVRFTAEISGGPDNSEELYCQKSTWGVRRQQEARRSNNGVRGLDAQYEVQAALRADPYL